MMRTMGAAGLATGAIVAALWGAPVSGAVMPGASASDTIDSLREQGYHVQLNGNANGPLSQCVVSGVSGLRGSHVGEDGRRLDTGRLDVAHVQLSCNDTV